MGAGSQGGFPTFEAGVEWLIQLGEPNIPPHYLDGGEESRTRAAPAGTAAPADEGVPSGSKAEDTVATPTATEGAAAAEDGPAPPASEATSASSEAAGASVAAVENPLPPVPRVQARSGGLERLAAGWGGRQNRRAGNCRVCSNVRQKDQRGSICGACETIMRRRKRRRIADLNDVQYMNLVKSESHALRREQAIASQPDVQRQAMFIADEIAKMLIGGPSS